MELIEDFDPNPIQISPANLLSKIWTNPRLVFKFINNHKYDKNVILLLVLTGIVKTFDKATVNHLGDRYSLIGVIAFCIISGGLFGWIAYYIYSALISWVGKALHGHANTQSVLRVLAYAMIPGIFSSVFLLPQIILYGNDVFKSGEDISNMGVAGSFLYYASAVFGFGLGIWSLVLCVIGISEIQQFSIGKAILNLLLPAAFFIFLILIIFGLLSISF